MKFEACRCPNCGGEIKFLDDKDFVFCTYCGNQVYKNDGTQKIRYDVRQHNINKNIDHTKINEQKTSVQQMRLAVIVEIMFLIAFVILALSGWF